MTTLMYRNSETKALTVQVFGQKDGKNYVSHSICSFDGDKFVCLDRKMQEVTAEDGNAHYRTLLKSGYRKVTDNPKYPHQWAICKRAMELRQGETKHLCNRCDGDGIYYTMVLNGYPKPASPDHGVCWRCLGSGWENKAGR